MLGPKEQFSVKIVFHLSGKRRLAVELNLDFLSLPHWDSQWMSAPAAFSVEVVRSREALAREVLSAWVGKKEGNLIVVSDELYTEGEPSDLALLLNGSALAFQRSLTLIALADAARAQPIFRVIPSGTEQIPFLRQAIEASAVRLQLLSSRSALLDGHSLSLKPLESDSHFKAALELRHRIFGALGYLPSYVEEDPSRFEMDYHDASSFHLGAFDEISRKLVGTIRLVLPHAPALNLPTLVGGAREVFQHQQDLVKKMRAEVRGDAYLHKLRNAGAASLPLIREVRPTGRWKHVLSQLGNAAESGRLVLHPHYRGLNLSTGLLDFAMVLALDLKKSAVIGECLPKHLPIYEQYGFEELDDRRIAYRPNGDHPTQPTEIAFDLSNPDRQALEKLKWKAELFRMANPTLESFRESLGGRHEALKQKLRGTK